MERSFTCSQLVLDWGRGAAQPVLSGLLVEEEGLHSVPNGVIIGGEGLVSLYSVGTRSKKDCTMCPMGSSSTERGCTVYSIDS